MEERWLDTPEAEGSIPSVLTEKSRLRGGFESRTGNAPVGGKWRPRSWFQ